ncbi:hypothetical protein [Sphingomonas parapaucimobilis]|uniref:hypothetical protein n=1 Tax=Sphingomonas parapaucimobilis TaxID=28213 RepID=UPI0039ED418C
MIDQASGKQKSSLNMSMKARTFGDRCLLDGQRTVRAVLPELNQRGFTRSWFSDSRSVLAKEAGMDGSSFIA